MKKIMSLILAVLAVNFALTAGENLVKKNWGSLAKKGTPATNSQLNGVLTAKNTAPTQNGFAQTIRLNQKQPKAIKFGGEARGTQVQGGTSSRFALYLDIHFTSGKPSYGNQVYFKSGTTNWTKLEKTLKFDRPIKVIYCYALFRGVSGEAQFRNIFLEEIK